MSNPDEEFKFVNNSIIKKYNEDNFKIDRRTILNGKNIIYNLINDDLNSIEKIYNFLLECIKNFINDISNKCSISTEENMLKILLTETNRFKKYIFYLYKLFEYLERIYLIPYQKKLIFEMAFENYVKIIFFPHKEKIFLSLSLKILSDKINRICEPETGILLNSIYKILENVTYKFPKLIKINEDEFEWEENILQFPKKMKRNINKEYIKKYLNDWYENFYFENNKKCILEKIEKYVNLKTNNFLNLLLEIIKEEENITKLYIPSYYIKKEIELRKDLFSELSINENIFDKEYILLLNETKTDEIRIINENIYPKKEEIKKKIPKLIQKQITLSIKELKNNKLISKDPLKFIPALFKLIEKWDKIISESKFEKMYIELKQNTLFKNLSEDFYAKQFSNYIDYLMRNRDEKIFKNDEEKEKTYNNIKNLHIYISCKYIFEIELIKKLSYRLIYNKTISFDKERKILSKIKDNCYIINFGKMKTMIDDIEKFTPDLIYQYKNSKFFYSSKFQINYKIISQNCFYIPNHKIFNLEIPNFLKSPIDSFADFYNNKNKSKKLNWCYGYCTLNIQYLYLSRQFISTSSLIQFCILIILEKYNKLTINKISEILGVNSSIIINEIYGLVFNKNFNPNKDPNKGVLIGNFKDNFEEKNEVELNNNFNFNSLKFNTLFTNTIDKKEEGIDEQYKLKYESNIILSTITRIMKSNAGKNVNHQWLLNKTQKEITQFLAQPPQIRIQIEKLIELEIIRRDDTLNNYIYVA